MGWSKVTVLHGCQTARLTLLVGGLLGLGVSLAAEDAVRVHPDGSVAFSHDLAIGQIRLGDTSGGTNLELHSNGATNYINYYDGMGVRHGLFGTSSVNTWAWRDGSNTQEQMSLSNAGLFLGAGLHINVGVPLAAPHVDMDNLVVTEGGSNGGVSVLTASDKNGYYGFGDQDDGFVGGVRYNHNNNRMYLLTDDVSRAELQHNYLNLKSGVSLRVDGETVIDTARNIDNIGNLTVSSGFANVRDTGYLSVHPTQSNRVFMVGANARWAGGVYVTPDSTQEGATFEIHRGAGQFKFGGIPAGGTAAIYSTIIGMGSVDSYFNLEGGDIGFGTDSPNLSGYNRALSIEAPVGGNAAVEFQQDGNVQGAVRVGIDGSIELRGEGQEARVRTTGSQAIRMYTSNNERLTIDGSTGNIGIGTAAPVEKLHVEGKGVFTGIDSKADVGIDGGTSTDIQLKLRMGSGSGGTNKSRVSYRNSSNTEIFYNEFDNADETFSIGSDVMGDLLTLNRATGHVTIQGDLIKDGAAYAHPDYVFEDDYELRELSEVAAFTERHKHLPGVPSAAEVTEHGLNMSEMMRLHLEKIEELTLYVIEAERERDQAQQELADVKQRLARLEALLPSPTVE